MAYCTDYSYTTPSERQVARIVTQLETLQSRESRFQADFTRWQRQRRETLEILTELREKLENVSVCANVARGAGSAAIIAGGLASLIGAIMEVNNAENSEQWLNAGEGLRKFGQMTVPVATLLELGVSEMFMSRVKSVLEKDQEYARPLEDWMRISRNLDMHIQEMFGCRFSSGVFNSVLSTFQKSLKLLGSGKENEAYQNLRGSGKATYQKFANFVEDVSNKGVEDLMGLVNKLSVVCQDSPHILQLCQSGVELSAAIYGQSPRMDLLTLLPVADQGLRMVGLDPFERSCCLEGVKIASEVVSLVSTAKNIAERKSEYCAKLDELKSKLSEELVAVSSASRKCRKPF